MSGFGQEHACLRLLLASAAAELSDMEQIGLVLQPLVAKAVEIGGAGEQQIEDAQALDRHTQHLAALSRFLLGLSDQVSPDLEVRIDGVRSSLLLAELERRLHGDASIPQTSAGEFEML